MLSRQEKIVLNHMEKYGSITSMDAFNNYNITRLSDRIFRLRGKGYEIETIKCERKNILGENVTFAKYKLIKPVYFAENREEYRLGL